MRKSLPSAVALIPRDSAQNELQKMNASEYQRWHSCGSYNLSSPSNIL